MIELYLATQNKHKIEELSTLLGDKFLIKSISELGVIEDIPETGITLAENSMQKAQFIADRFGLTCLSDDSGLEVDCLGGLPGVHSARYAGEPKNDVANSKKLIFDMSDCVNRSARFVTVLTFHHKGQYHQFEGEIRGEIVLVPREIMDLGMILCSSQKMNQGLLLKWHFQKRISSPIGHVPCLNSDHMPTKV